jgi:flagellar FliJ protein
MAQPRFEFRLEALLDHRKQIEKEHQRKVADIQQQIQKLLREIQDAEARISAENRTLSTQKLVGKLDMQYISHEKRYVGNLHMKIVLTMQQLAKTQQLLAAARAELLTAARSRKVIEKLREKQFARWRAEQDRKDAALMDEIGTQAAIREAYRNQNDIQHLNR